MSYDRLAPRWLPREWGLVLILAAVAIQALVVHDIEYIMDQPFWLNEAWVAGLSFLSGNELRLRATGVPYGWLLLMRLVPGDSEQRFRLLGLAFSVGSGVVAALLASGLRWTERWQRQVAAFIVGSAAILSPVALRRNDLKHYTAAAFVALLVLLLAARLDQRWTRPRFIGFIAVAVTGALVSYASMFVTAAVFIAIAVIAAGADRKHLTEVLVGGLFTAAAFLAIGFGLVLPGMNRELLNAYWGEFYLVGHSSIGELGAMMWERLEVTARAVGIGSVFVGIALAVMGIIALRRTSGPRLALGVGLLLPVMVVLGLSRIYPFLDIRTSHFLLISFVVVAAIGLVFVATRPESLLLKVGTLFLLFAAVVAIGWPSIRSHSIPNQDVRSQVRHVEAALEQQDVVLVNMTGSHGVGYYWRGETPHFVENETLSTGWMMQVNRPNFVYATDRTLAGIAGAVDEAINRAGTSGGRVWIIRSHVLGFEANRWQRAFADRNLHPTTLSVGVEPLVVLDP